MADSEVVIGVQLDPASEEDEQRLDELTARLRRELLELDVESVDRPAGEDAPPGSRGLDLAAAGLVVVRLAKSAAGLKAVIRHLQDWLTRNDERTVKLEVDGDTLEMTGITSAQQDLLITAWVERHTD